MDDERSDEPVADEQAGTPVGPDVSSVRPSGEGEESIAAEGLLGSLDFPVPAERIVAVLADFEKYPEWAEYVTDTEVLATGDDGMPARVRFHLHTEFLDDTYVLDYTWSADRRHVEWTLVSSTLQESQVGSYTLLPTADGTHVEYRLTVKTVMPLFGRLRSRVERAIAAMALTELRRRVDEVSG